MMHTEAVLRPFVLKCPNCVAPVEEGAIICRYCNVRLKWEAVIPIDRDDFRMKFESAPKSSHTYKEDGQYLPFPTVAVPGGSSSSLSAIAQLPFKPARLVVPAEMAEGFYISDFRIGNRSNLISPTSIPATLFTPDKIGLGMGMDTIMPGMMTTLVVINMTAMTRNFTAVLEGKVFNGNDARNFEKALSAFGRSPR